MEVGEYESMRVREYEGMRLLRERVQGSDRARLNRRCNSVVPVVEALKKMNVSRIVAESV